MKTIFLIISAGLFYIITPKVGNKTITTPNDYNKFLIVNTDSEILKCEVEYDFWNRKLKEAPHQYPYLLKMSSIKNNMFSLNGDINYLENSTVLLEKANDLTKETNASILRMLAKNYISQHRFDESFNALLKAEKLAEKLSETQKMLFDVNMELGNYELAEHYLNQIRDKNSFDFRIRKSKWEDHSGDLDEAIFQMEMALDGAKSNNKSELIQWCLTNLGDYYGHAGKINKSYNRYLRALELKPYDAYSKKGIAWILYSYERNTKEASRILDVLDNNDHSLDYSLFKAEIAEFKKDFVAQNLELNKYQNQLMENCAYRNMYNKYNVTLYAEHRELQSLAKDIALEEIKLRPTAQSYSLLAWAEFKIGNTNEAIRIVKSKVLNKTFEPEPLFIAAKILKKDKACSELDYLKTELLESVYELGPIAETQISEL